MVDSKTIATMKNLFKNLMLVAVAAMAFTACSEDNNEVNEVAKKTVISGVLNIVNDDTRSGFTGSYTEDEKTYYQSAWDGGETIKIFVDGVDDPVTTTIDKEGRFEVKLEGELPESFFMTVCSPADSWSSKDIPTIPAEQTPLANSVDPSAHILKAQNVQVTNGSADAADMVHEVAYGKMTVNGVDFDIDHVVVNLKGTYYMTYERECTYTINADNVQNNVFWFTTETFENVTEFTVTAYDAEGNAVTKTVDVAAADKTLAFNYGHVSTFSVSGLEAVAEPDTVMDSAKYYYSYNNYAEYPEWGYVVFEDEYLGTLVLNCKFPNDDLVLRIGTYSAGDYTQGFDVAYSYYNVVGDSPYNLYYPSYMYVEVENGAYKLNFDIINTNGQTLKATYVGDIEGLGYPDLRTPLATPTNVTATAEGKIITIKWDAVEGADGYRVKLDSPYDEYKEEIVTTNEYVYEAKLYSKQYSFTIMSYANDENVTYKSSDDAYAYVTTGKDPSIVPIAFTTCELNEYIQAQWRVSYNFSDGANNSMTLWLTTDHGANDTSLGSTNNYDRYYSSPGSVGGYYRFCPENVIVNGVSKTVTGGNVQVNNLGLSWDVTMMLSFSDGTMQEFTYSGGIGTDSGDEGGSDDGEFVPDFTITSFSYVQLSSNYFTHQWSVSTSNGLSFNIYTPYSQGSELLEGTYNYYSGNGKTNGDYTFSTRLFSPAPGSGVMKVSKSGNTYTINLTLVVGSATQKYQFVGEI